MNLISFIKSNKEARRIFGQQELLIIEKQLLGINLTQSEKNRLSRDIRKKLEFIRDISRFSDEFKLKKGQEIKNLIEETKEAILEMKHFPKIKKIYLFGSTAEKAQIFRSDIDIAVEFDNITLKEATLFRIKTRVPEKVDLQVYNILPEKIKREINEKGKIIYERKN